jgi:Squalene/phytoene synthase
VYPCLFSYRDVIKDITKRMGNGMADFLSKTVVTVKDWDLYCHYVAGLVGIGLSNLFAASQLEGGQVWWCSLFVCFIFCSWMSGLHSSVRVLLVPVVLTHLFPVCLM